MKLSIRCWLQDPMTRIFPEDRPPRERGRPFLPCAARGEVALFQVGLRADGVNLNYIAAVPSDLRSAGGARLPAAAVEALYPEYVPVKWVAGGQTAADVERVPPAFFPDPLPREWKLDVAGPVGPPCRSIWVRVRVPRDAKPGLYAGRLTITAGRRNFKAENQAKGIEFERKFAVAFRLRVWGFELPRRTALLNTNWLFADQLAQWYNVKMWSEPYWALLEAVARDMADHRQNVILTPLLGGAEAGHQLVGVRRSGRRYDFDFRRLERWGRLFFAHGFEKLEGGHIAPNSRKAQSYWAAPARGGAPKLVKPGDSTGPEYLRFLGQFFAALWGFLARRGWRGRWLQHITDEPGLDDLPNYRKLAEAVRAAAPGIKLIDALTDPPLCDQNDHPVPLEDGYERAVAESHVPRENIWVYYCCGPTGKWPNRYIEYPLVRLRIISWICFQKRIPGFLHWGYNFWSGIRQKTHNPWDDPTTHRHQAGDGLVVYPPRDERMTAMEPVASIRWEILRKAMEDHAYLVMARELAEGGDKAARKILADVARRIVPGWTNHTRDWRRLEEIRERIAALLERK